jgi:hypothetical protein
MAFKRSLMIDKGRLLSKRWERVSLQETMWGYTCHCCQIPGLPWRFLPSGAVESVALRKFHYLWKRHPKMMKKLSDQKAAWCERTGRGDDGWWQEMVERYVP